MVDSEDHANPVANHAEKPGKEAKDGAAGKDKDDSPADEMLAMAQASNDAAATATKNAERAYKLAEEAKNGAAEANTVAQNAKTVAVYGALFGAAATVVALLAVYGNLIGN